MTARWSYVGPRPRAGAAVGEAPRPGSAFRAAWFASWLTRGVFIGACAAFTISAGIDIHDRARDSYAVIVTDDGPRVVGQR